MTSKEGATVTALTAERFLEAKEQLQAGGKLIGLGCLSWLHSEWSWPHYVVPEAKIEALGRKLWGTNHGISANARPSTNAFELPDDNYWEENTVSFPSSWPDKCNLPIVVRDTGAFPRKRSFKLAALDEVVVSFWRFLQHCFQ